MPGPDGKGVMHAEIRIGNSIIMMGTKARSMPVRAQKPPAAPPSVFSFISKTWTRHSRRPLKQAPRPDAGR